MTAAHYIALLLLSTAAEGSREHLEIIEYNGEGIWLSLHDLNLVERDGAEEPWHLTERGRVLVEYLLELPLPEQVSAWKMPGVAISMPRMPTVEAQWPIPGSVTWVPGADIEDGPPPPKPPLPKPIPGITPASDPDGKRAQARELINRGYGTSEIADTLEMSQSEVEQIFFAGS